MTLYCPWPCSDSCSTSAAGSAEKLKDTSGVRGSRANSAGRPGTDGSDLSIAQASHVMGVRGT